MQLRPDLLVQRGIYLSTVNYRSDATEQLIGTMMHLGGRCEVAVVRQMLASLPQMQKAEKLPKSEQNRRRWEMVENGVPRAQMLCQGVFLHGEFESDIENG